MGQRRGKLLVILTGAFITIFTAGARPVARGAISIVTGASTAGSGGVGGGGFAFLWSGWSSLNFSRGPAITQPRAESRASAAPGIASRWFPSLFPLRGSSTSERARSSIMPMRGVATSNGEEKKQGAKGGRGASTKKPVMSLGELEKASQILWSSKKKRDPPSSGDPIAHKRARQPLADVEAAAAASSSSSSGVEGEGMAAVKVKGKKKAAAVPVSQDDGSHTIIMAKDKLGKATLARVATEPPAGWREIYDLVLELRKERDAPVDWAGSEALGINKESGEVNEYHVFMALMLSSQTKDQTVAEAMRNLTSSPGGLSVESVLAMSNEELDGHICKVGFHNNKTKFIKQSAQIMKEKFGGSVPRTAEGLISLPGIGPKMAYIILHVAFNIVEGIGIDTHMHRIFNVLGWVSSKQPEQTRVQLESWLPREEWDAINILFVGLGQMTQQPKERANLVRRCLASSKPLDALRLCHCIGTDLSLPDPATGMTPLMVAAGSGQKEEVEVLVGEFKVRAGMVDKEGRTAYDHAVQGKHDEVATLLRPKA